MSAALTAILAAALGVLVVALAVRLPFVSSARRLAGTAGKAVRLMANPRVSDHWKERAILRYAGTVFASTALLALLLAAVAGLALGAAYAVEQGLPGFVAFLAGPLGLLTTLAAASLFLWVRGRV